MMQLTCSRLGLASHCLYWLREDVAHEDVPSEARDVGTTFHALAAAAINGGDPQIDGSSPVWPLWESARELARPGPGKRAEVAYAFDPITRSARELGVDIGRDYDAAGARPGEICGSADVVIDRMGDGLEVRDWKTGQDCGPPATSPQLRSLASMASLVTGATLVRVAYDYVDAREVRSSVASLDDFALRDLIPLELTVLADRVARDGPTSTPTPGPWCEANHHCPAFHHCPAQRARAEAAAPAHVRHLPVLQDATAAIGSASAAAQIIASLNALQGLVKIWWHKLDEYADTVGPIDLGDGKSYRGWDEVHESIVLDDPAELALEEHFGAAYKAKIKRSLTKESIEALVRARDPSRGMKARVEAVLASLRAAGSTRPKTVRKHGVK